LEADESWQGHNLRSPFRCLGKPCSGERRLYPPECIFNVEERLWLEMDPSKMISH
jgi:hypothetical protein